MCRFTVSRLFILSHPLCLTRDVNKFIELTFECYLSMVNHVSCLPTGLDIRFCASNLSAAGVDLRLAFQGVYS